MAHIGTGRYFQWIEDGVVRALPEDLSAWPDLEWTINNTGVREYDVDGRTYALPRGGAKVLPSSHPELATSNLSWGGRTLFVRKDWMETLGIDDPQTAEEFIEMCVRFATDDPDGNGEDDTMGFSLRALWPFYSQSFGYGYTDGSWVKVGDEYHIGTTTRAAFELFSFLRELYQRGGLDPDFILNTGGWDSADLFATDKAGLTNFQSVPVHYNGFMERWKQFNPGPELLRPREGAAALPGRRLRLPRHRARRGDRFLVGELHRRHGRRREAEPHPGPLRLDVQLGRHHDGHVRP